MDIDADENLRLLKIRYDAESARPARGPLKGSVAEKMEWRRSSIHLTCDNCVSLGLPCIRDPETPGTMRCVNCINSLTECSCLDAYLHWRARKALAVTGETWRKLTEEYPYMKRWEYAGKDEDDVKSEMDNVILINPPAPPSSKVKMEDIVTKSRRTPSPLPTAVSDLGLYRGSLQDVTLVNASDEPPSSHSPSRAATSVKKEKSPAKAAISEPIAPPSDRLADLQAQLDRRTSELKTCRKVLAKTQNDLSESRKELSRLRKRPSRVEDNGLSPISGRQALRKKPIGHVISLTPPSSSSSEAELKQVRKQLEETREQVKVSKAKQGIYEEKAKHLTKLFTEFNQDNVSQYVHIQKCHERLKKACVEFESRTITSRQYLTMVQDFLPHLEEMGKRRLHFIPMDDGTMDFEAFLHTSQLGKRVREEEDDDDLDDEVMRPPPFRSR